LVATFSGVDRCGSDTLGIEARFGKSVRCSSPDVNFDLPDDSRESSSMAGECMLSPSGGSLERQESHCCSANGAIPTVTNTVAKTVSSKIVAWIKRRLNGKSAPVKTRFIIIGGSV
jgi:hypothetical protein